MSDLTAIDDIDHYWGSDVIAGLTGDLGRSSRATRSIQRVLRRLLTNPGEYIWHPTYGAGLAREVGKLVDRRKIQALIGGQMMLEASVARTPPPQVVCTDITNGLHVAIAYTILPDRQPVSLAFKVEP
jgi:hypothetical protein